MARQWADEFRALNRLPFVLGIFSLFTGVLGMAVLVALLLIAFGAALIAAYYRFREDG